MNKDASQHQRILNAIRELRTEHFACTARAVGQRLRMSPDYVRYQVDQMRKAGLVTWTRMPGSLRVIEQESKTTSSSQFQTQDDTPEATPPASLPAKAVKKSPSKKATATKKAAPTLPSE